LVVAEADLREAHPLGILLLRDVESVEREAQRKAPTETEMEILSVIVDHQVSVSVKAVADEALVVPVAEVNSGGLAPEDLLPKAVGVNSLLEETGEALAPILSSFKEV